jgi:hypothetical protein
MLRDKCNDLHQQKNTKCLINLKRQHDTNQTNTIARQKHKANHTDIDCHNCGTMVKNQTGLSEHSDTTKTAKSQQHRGI